MSGARPTHLQVITATGNPWVTDGSDRSIVRASGGGGRPGQDIERRHGGVVATPDWSSLRALARRAAEAVEELTVEETVRRDTDPSNIGGPFAGECRHTSARLFD